MTNWAEHKPASCYTCTLLNQPGPCWGYGDKQNAKLIYIGQNPGLHEVAATPMQPFIGPSGRIRNRQFFEAGIRLDEVFSTNQVKCLTPDNRLPTPQEVRYCRPLLESEMNHCRADTVVLAGDLALKAHLDKFSSISSEYHPVGGIFSRMGCVERREGRKWIATIHPAFVLRMPEWKQAAVDHLKKAWIVSGIPLQEIKINERPTDSEVRELVEFIILHGRSFADDVETAQIMDMEEDDYVGGDYHVTMCGIGARPYEALVLDPKQILLLAPIFADETIEHFEHNGIYDQFHLERELGEIKAKPFDTMQATHFLRSFAPKKLKPFTLSQYTLLPYYQGAGSKKDNLGALNMRLYNGMDVITTFLAAREMKRQLRNWQLEEVFAEFGMPILPALEDMRREGVNCDLRKALVFKRVLEHRIDKAANAISKLAGLMFNYNSPKQVAELLYSKMKLPTQYNERGGGERSITTDFEARKRLRHWIEAGRLEQYKPAYNLLQLLDFINGEEKKLEYISRISGDGRMHPFYKAHGTRTFRLSSSPNLQNFPVYDINDWGGARRDDFETADHPIGEDKGRDGLGSLRSLVVPDNPDTDWILTCDFEQLQLWLYAIKFKVKWLLQVFESKEYIYGVVYEALYKEPFFKPGKPKTKEFKLTEVPEQRVRRAKAVPLGFVKGRSLSAVAREYGWEDKEARDLYNWWFGLCPELLQAMNDTRYKLVQQGWLRYAFGQVMHFPSGKLTDALDSNAQCEEAFVLRGSLISVAQQLRTRGLRQRGNRLMLTTHDSLSLNVHHTDVVEVYEEVVAPVLNRSIPQLGGFRFRHSADLSKQWDWNTMSYSSWKAKYGTESNTRAASSDSYQSSGRQEIST